MKKRFVPLLLIIGLIMSLVPFTAHALTPPGRVDGVDYTRIEENTMLQLPIKFTVGGKQFDGMLQNGKTIGKDEVDNIIKQVMKDSKITTGNLYRAKYVMQKATQLLGYNLEHVAQLGLKIALGAIGLDNIGEIYSVIKGEKEVAGTAANMLIGEALAGVAKNQFGGWAKLVVSGLWAGTEQLNQDIARLIEENEIAQEAIEWTIRLNVFYSECNARIAEAEKKAGGSTWSITAGQTLMTAAKFFNIDVIQWWRLSCNLQRTDYIYGDDEDPTNYGGVYRGTMVIDIWHDLSNFDDMFLDEIFSTTIIYKALQSVYYFRDLYSSPSTLTKNLINTEIEIHLDQRNMTSSGMEEYFDLTDFQDTSAFYTNHPIQGWLKNKYFNSNGEMAVYNVPVYYPDDNFWGYTNVTGPMNTVYEHNGKLLLGNRYAQLNWAGMRSNYKLTVSPLPIVGSYTDDSGNLNMPTGKYGVPFKYDFQIFKDLDNKRGSIKVLGR